MFLIDFILHIDTHIYAMANTVGLDLSIALPRYFR